MHMNHTGERQSVPANPFPDFERALGELSQMIAAARARREEHESRAIDAAIEEVDSLEAEADVVDVQLQRLRAVQSELEAEGSFGQDGRERADSMILQLQRYRDELQAALSSPRLKDAQRMRDERDRKTQDEVALQASAPAVDADAELRVLTAEVEVGIRHLDHVGPQEQIVMLHLWLGKLRRLQEAADFETEPFELRQAFGRIKACREQMKIGHFFDALSRNFDADWDAYLARYRAQLPVARENDRISKEAQRARAELRAQRERRDQADRAESAERLGAAVEDLRELAAVWGTDPSALEIEDVRALLRVGARSGGCAQVGFLEVAAPFAPLSYGSEFRGLRRSLRKAGVADVATAEPPTSDRFADQFRRLIPIVENKSLMIVGGIPNAEVAGRIKQGLGLGECRWYEHHRKDHHDDARSALSGGGFDGVLLLIRFAGHRINELRDVARAAGTQAFPLDRGCGMTAILRGVEALFAPAERTCG